MDTAHTNLATEQLWCDPRRTRCYLAIGHNGGCARRGEGQSDTTDIGTRPTGSQAPDGTHRWATRTRNEDGFWKFATYDGWLISSETTTDDQALADLITAEYQRRYEQGTQ